MKTPKIIPELLERVIAVIDEDKGPTLTPEQAGRALGFTAESIINAAEQNNCPFGMCHRKAVGMRRNVAISKLVFWNWVTQGQWEKDL